MKPMLRKALWPNRYLWFMVAILLAGAFLRIYDLGTESIWVDEGFAIRAAKLSVSQGIDLSIGQDRHPPLHIFLLHFWEKTFGTSEFGTRLLSAVFGILAIYFIYKIGGALFDRPTGTLAALLLAFSPYQVRYSQEVRMYALLALLAAASMYFFIKLLQRRSFFNIAAYAVCSVLLLYTHTFGVLIVVAQNAYIVVALVLGARRNWPLVPLKTWVPTQVAFVVLFAPWLRYLLQHVGLIGSGFWIPDVTALSMPASIYSFSGSVPLALLFGALCFAGLFVYRKGDNVHSLSLKGWRVGLPNVDKSALLVSWLVVPMVIPFVASLVWTSVYLTRVVIGASVALYLLVARGIRALGNRWIQVGVACLIVALSVGVLRGYYTRVDKEQWREATAYVEEQAQPGDLLAFDESTSMYNGFRSYSVRDDLDEQILPKIRTVNANAAKQVRTVAGDRDRLWLIFRDDKEKPAQLSSRLSQWYSVADRQSYVLVEVYLLTRK
jgi:mannosyltransferase